MSHSQQRGGKTVVLLVQPDRDDRAMYAEFLHHEGFTPVLASTVQDALVAAPSADVIITGIRLHGPGDGVELMMRLRSDERTSRTPVIVLTTHVWQAARDRASAAGCHAFLPKPCLPDALLRAIHGAMAFRRLSARPPVAIKLLPGQHSRQAS